MAYDVYTLTGYVLEIKDSGEFDKRFKFLSKEHGIINILAIGTAKPASKLRGFITRFAKIDIDVVHGKSGYRLVRARCKENGFVVHKKEAYMILSRISDFLSNILPLHAAHNESFLVFEKLATYLENNIVTDEKINSIFYTFALELLGVLGYRQVKDIPESEREMQNEYEHVLNENGMSNVI